MYNKDTRTVGQTVWNILYIWDNQSRARHIPCIYTTRSKTGTGSRTVLAQHGRAQVNIAHLSTNVTKTCTGKKNILYKMEMGWSFVWQFVMSLYNLHSFWTNCPTITIYPQNLLDRQVNMTNVLEQEQGWYIRVVLNYSYLNEGKGAVMLPGSFPIILKKKKALCSERWDFLYDVIDLYVERNALLNRKCSHFNSTVFTQSFSQRRQNGVSPNKPISSKSNTHQHEELRFHLPQGCNRTRPSLTISMCPDWSYLYPGWCPILTYYIRGMCLLHLTQPWCLFG